MNVRGDRSFLACLVALVAWTSSAGAQPANDNCAAATVIAALPFSNMVSTTLATVGAGDPIPSCGGPDNNVWYSYTAPADTSLHVRTDASNYCTAVAVYTGGCGALTEIGCGTWSPTCVGGKGETVIPLRAGASVLIAVSSVPGPGGGTLVLDADLALPAYFPNAPTVEAILSSDPSPLGGAYGTFPTVSLRSRRGLAFAADSGGIFVRDAAGVLTTLAVAGDPTPIGGTFAIFGEPSVNDAGTVVFQATVDGAPDGVFSYNTGVISPLLLEGSLAPDGGQYVRFDEDVVVNQIGAVAFHGRTTAAPLYERLFVYDGLSTTLVASVNDANPCGGIFDTVAAKEPRGFSLADTTTDVAFVGSANGGGDGVFYFDGVGLTAVVCEGDPAPGGGTHRRIGLQPSVNGLGDVYFVTEVNGGPSPDVLWRWNAGVVTPSVGVGTVLDSGETVAGLHYRQEIDSNVNGYLVFIADVGPDAIVLRDPTASVGKAIAKEADACPTGGTIGSLDLNVAASSAGDVVFEANCRNGRATFRVPFGGAPVATGSVLDATAIGTGFRFFDPQVNAFGASVFKGYRSGLYTTSCPGGVCAPAVAVAAAGDPVPGLVGQHFDTIHSATFNGRANVQAFSAITAGALGQLSAIVGVGGGVPFTIASVGQTLPGGVGEFNEFPTNTVFGDLAMPSVGRGVLAFYAWLLGHPTGGEGIYAYTSAGLVEVAVQGGLSPTGGTFDLFGAPQVRKRTVTFRATTNIDDCLYRQITPGAPLSVLVCDGDPAPPSIGGTLDLQDTPPSGTARFTVFHAGVSGGSASDCMFALVNGMLEVIQCEGEPYILGAYVSAFPGPGSPVSPAAETNAKGLVYSQSDGSPAAPGTSIVAVRRGIHYPLFSTLYDLSPSGGEFAYNGFAPPSMFGKTVAFASTLRGGPVTGAVFLGQLP